MKCEIKVKVIFMRKSMYASDPVDPNRLRQVLDDLLAAWLEAERELSLHLLEGGSRHADAAGLGQALHPRCHVHAVSEDPLPVDEDVAEIDADPEQEPALGLEAGVGPFELVLDLDGTAHGVDHARELGEEVVAGVVHDASPAFGDAVANQLAVGAQDPSRPLLVARHVPAEADGVGRENRGQPAVQVRFLQAGTLDAIRGKIYAP